MNTRPTVAEIFRAHGEEFLAAYGTRLLSYVKKALWYIAHCRTEALGSTIVACPTCGYREQRFNSCRHRGCPQCEGAKDAEWMKAREEELLPVHYFHAVFTVPHVLNVLFLGNARQCYAIMFQAVAKTILTVGKNRLNAKLGFFSVLHTWGQLLTVHPHIHCVVPGGGIREDGSWVQSSKRRRYLAPEKVLSEVFRGILLKALRRAYRRNTIRFDGDFELLLSVAAKHTWVVYAQPPFDSPRHVLMYLSRYIRKVALSNSRLISLEKGVVSFSFKDYAAQAIQKVARLSALEFMRRFLLHIPPPGFVRIRYYGFMAGKGRKQRLTLLREVIAGLLPVVIKDDSQSTDSFLPGRCPVCAIGFLIVVTEIPARRIRKDSS